MKRVLAVILGGGRGSRLFPLTKLRAKPAVPIAGKYRLIDIPVSNCINSSVNKIYVLTQFNSASLNRHIGITYDFSPFSDGFVEVLAAQQTPVGEDWFQGTADAVRKYLIMIEETDIDDVLILSGDHLYRMDYRPFIDQHRKQEADITISVIPVQESQASSFGLLKIDDKGRVNEFSEKPKGKDLQRMAVDTTSLGQDEKEAARFPYIASMGIYVFKKQVLIDLLKNNPSQDDFGKQILPQAIETNKIYSYLFPDYWEDIGTIEAFYKANMALVKYPNPSFSFYHPDSPIYTHQRFLPPCKLVNNEIIESMLCEGCVVERATIRRSIIGIRSIISEGAVIEDSLIMGSDFFKPYEKRIDEINEGKIPIGIGRNSVIRNAIVDKNARIGQNVRIINQNGVQVGGDEKDGFLIRDGIVVVMKNAVIQDNTII